jgi:hypothetical protein
VFIALGTQLAMQVDRISSAAWPALKYFFHIIKLKTRFFSGKKIIARKIVCFDFCLQILFEKFLILRKIDRGINLCWSSSKVTAIRVRF